MYHGPPLQTSHMLNWTIDTRSSRDDTEIARCRKLASVRCADVVLKVPQV